MLYQLNKEKSLKILLKLLNYFILQIKCFCLPSLQNDPIKLGKDEYMCPFCNKIMKKHRDMKRHILIHTGEKPFKCELCNFACNQKANLTTHLKKHQLSEITLHDSLFKKV